MKKHIYEKHGLNLIRIVEDTPKCNIDFCDTCGECLHCEAEMPCPATDREEHFWSQYGEEN